MADFEITVIGAGVVGLSIASRLSQRHPNLLVLEKNEKHGMEISSRNSEVIHAGIYYQPGSLKAKLCVEGRDELYRICKQHHIAHRQVTKIITATDEAELAKLNAIYANGRKNGVQLELLDRSATLKLEPNINTVGSIYSPLTGTISAHELTDFLFHQTTEQGATVQLRCEVVAIEKVADGYNVTIEEGGKRSSFTSEIVINAAGLSADRIAGMTGIDVDKEGYRQVYAKGSYFVVVPSKARLLSRLVYPVPSAEGLGVHAIMDWGGRLKFGPDVEYLHDGAFDYRVSESKRKAFGGAIRRIVPGISDDDISPDMSGIRPKLQRKGEPEKDFLIVHEKERGLSGFVNLVGIDSPGLTASPAIAAHVERLLFA
jgi:L-2-hydroxyglutarate oxidase LhgO